MDNVNILLPCGFSVKYKKVIYNRNKFKCPACKTHELTIQECLKMTRNRLILTMKSFELKKKQYEECLKTFEKYEMDPMHFIDLSHDKFKSEIDLRREEIKIKLNKKIDDYYDDLLNKIDIERYSRLKQFKEKINDLDLTKKEIDSIKIDHNLDVHSKLDSLRENKIIIENGINLVSSIENNLNRSNLGLTKSIEDLDIKKLFGELYLKEETSFNFNKNDTDELSRTVATIQLKINDFAKLIKQKDFDINSEVCFLRNFEWSIHARLNKKEKDYLGLYLPSRSIDNPDNNKSIGFPIKANVNFFILNRLNSSKNIIQSFNYLYSENYIHGCLPFVEINKLIDPTNGYYNPESDFIAIEVVFHVELPDQDKK